MDSERRIFAKLPYELGSECVSLPAGHSGTLKAAMDNNSKCSEITTGISALITHP